MTHSLITPIPVSTFHHPQFDDLDAAIVCDRFTARGAYQSGPLTGDWVRMHDGQLHQLAEIGAKPKFSSEGGSFYFERDGSMSYRGNWTGGAPALDRLTATHDRLTAAAWIFHHDQWRPGTEVGFTIGLRVWQGPWMPSP